MTVEPGVYFILGLILFVFVLIRIRDFSFRFRLINIQEKAATALVESLGGKEITIRTVTPRRKTEYLVATYVNKSGQFVERQIRFEKKWHGGLGYHHLGPERPYEKSTYRSRRHTSYPRNLKAPDRDPQFETMSDALADQMALIRKGGDWDGAFREIESFDGEKKKDKKEVCPKDDSANELELK